MEHAYYACESWSAGRDATQTHLSSFRLPSHQFFCRLVTIWSVAISYACRVIETCLTFWLQALLKNSSL